MRMDFQHYFPHAFPSLVNYEESQLSIHVQLSLELLERDGIFSSPCFPLDSIAYSGGSRISPRRGRQLPGGANIRFCHIFPKTAWNWKNLGPVPRVPLRSATGIIIILPPVITARIEKQDGTPGNKTHHDLFDRTLNCKYNALSWLSIWDMILVNE